MPACIKLQKIKREFVYTYGVHKGIMQIVQDPFLAGIYSAFANSNL